MAQDTFFSSKKTLRIGDNILTLDEPMVMGILNVTPDSFYDNSRVKTEKNWLSKAEQMIAAGAPILDIGGYSSRPGAEDISIQEEAERVLPVIRSIRNEFPSIIISVDTFRHEVAQRAIEAGANIINDISGGNLDDKMFETVANLKVPYILMHMKGTPQTMKNLAQYDRLIIEMIDYFQEKLSQLRNLGVADLIIDPGFGFAKTLEQNFEILEKLQEFKMLELPLLVGLSRKSMIYKSLDVEPNDALNGTTALHTMALMNGASILRVHDVKEAVESIKLYKLTYIK